MKKISKRNKAQTAIELAVFGAILIFMLGIIVRQGLNAGYQQNQNLKAMRQAMKTSFEYSEGVFPKNTEQNPFGYGTASRNRASVIIIEDRLTAESRKYGVIDRIPLILNGSASHTRNLFMPVEAGELWNLPRQDVFINGKHFNFSVAGFKSIKLKDTTRIFPTKIPNHPAMDEWDENCGACFDLDRDGTIEQYDEPDSPILRENFSWQWVDVTVPQLKDGDYSQVDIDGDLKEESVLRVADGWATMLDFQEGEINVSIDSTHTGPRPGLTDEIQMFAFTRNPETGGDTFFIIDEGKLFSTDPTKQFIRNTSKKDSVDVIQRVIQLSNNKPRFCAGSNRLATDLYDNMPHPIEVCCSASGCSNGASNCFDSTDRTLSKTCMDTNTLKIYVRSRISDKHGRRWITDLSTDPEVNFTRP